MNALYRGLIVSGVIAAIAFYFVTTSMMGDAAMPLFGCALIGLVLTGRDDRDHRVLHRHRIRAGALRGRGLADRPRHQRDRRPRASR